MTEEEINVAICRHFGWRFKGDLYLIEARDLQEGEK